MKRAYQWLGGICLMLLMMALLFWGLVKLVVPGLIQDQARQLGTQIGYEIEVGEIELTPFDLRLQLHDLRIAPLKGRRCSR